MGEGEVFSIYVYIYIYIYGVCVCVREGIHPVVGQLQSQLDEGVRADPALLHPALPKLLVGEHVEVHVISQSLRNLQRPAHLLLALGHTHTQYSSQEEVETGRQADG